MYFMLKYIKLSLKMSVPLSKNGQKHKTTYRQVEKFYNRVLFALENFNITDGRITN